MGPDGPHVLGALLREPRAEGTARKAEHLAVIDAVLTRTLPRRAHGDDEFLLLLRAPAPFRDVRRRSFFVDGEIALMLAARQLVEPRADLAPLLRERIDTIARPARARAGAGRRELSRRGVRRFCNTVALAALRLYDAVDGCETTGSCGGAGSSRRASTWWIARTGLLRLELHLRRRQHAMGRRARRCGSPAHMLQVVDADFAREQYERARRELIGRARSASRGRAEWPEACARRTTTSTRARPFRWSNANAGSSGLALRGGARPSTTSSSLEGLRREPRASPGSPFQGADDDGLRCRRRATRSPMRWCCTHSSKVHSGGARWSPG